MKPDRYAYVCLHDDTCPVVPTDENPLAPNAAPVETIGWTVGLLVEESA